jgi:hypothetical protein
MVYFNYLFLGDTAAQILRKLPKLIVLERNGYPLSFDELSAVSSNLLSLSSGGGLNIDTFQIGLHLLSFPHLENVQIYSTNDSNLHLIIKILENSLSSSIRRVGSLKSFKLYRSTFQEIDLLEGTISIVDYGKLRTSLNNIIEVCFELTDQRRRQG